MVEIELDRPAIARHGRAVVDVQDVVDAAPVAVERTVRRYSAGGDLLPGPIRTGRRPLF